MLTVTSRFHQPFELGQAIGCFLLQTVLFAYFVDYLQTQSPELGSFGPMGSREWLLFVAGVLVQIVGGHLKVTKNGRLQGFDLVGLLLRAKGKVLLFQNQNVIPKAVDEEGNATMDEELRVSRWKVIVCAFFDVTVNFGYTVVLLMTLPVVLVTKKTGLDVMTAAFSLFFLFTVDDLPPPAGKCKISEHVRIRTEKKKDEPRTASSKDPETCNVVTQEPTSENKNKKNAPSDPGGFGFGSAH